MIKDSGERTKFPSGALRDMHTGKGRMDLLPWLAIMEVSKHCEAGALKYGEHNVDKGIPTHSLLDSAIRHAAKYLAGYIKERRSIVLEETPDSHDTMSIEYLQKCLVKLVNAKNSGYVTKKDIADALRSDYKLINNAE